jgi:hypothetical protein
LKELRISAWLHDVGKITTPEYIIDKAKKLQTIYDRIETLKMRFEILKRDYVIEVLKKKLAGRDDAGEEKVDGYEAYLEELKKEFDFLVDVNTGSTFMDKQLMEKLQKITTRKWVMNGLTQNLAGNDEFDNLSIPQGTLTNEEKEIIRNHVTVTYKMLSQLPFPKKFRSVSGYASFHHERLDGEGYPFGLKGTDIPLQARIIALADIFDALTAKDRPYKKEKTLSEALAIMRSMVEANHIDGELFDLFIKERIYLDYAQKELTPQQIDMR